MLKSCFGNYQQALWKSKNFVGPLRCFGWMVQKNHIYGWKPRCKCKAPVSCSHEGNMRYQNIPKLTVCLICMKPLSLQKILMQFLKPKTHRGIYAVMFFYFPSPGMRAVYVLCKQQYILYRKHRWAYKASLSTYNKRAGTIRWKW